MKIEFGELRLGDLAKKNIQECIDRGWLTLGPKTEQYEKAFANLFKYKYGVAVNSGTSACMAACMALWDYCDNIEGTPEVIVPALSFIATTNAVRAAGMQPVWVDVTREHMNINVDLIELSITENTIAIMAVNTMGRPCVMSRLKDICDRHNLYLISDNCEAYGCRYLGNFMLDFADMETVSCYVAHIISTTEGGLCFTNDFDLNYILKSIRSHGREPDSLYFQHDRYGLNLKPTDLTSAIGLEGVENFWGVFNRRRANFLYLYRKLEDWKDIAWFTEEDDGNINCAHAFSITLKPKYTKLINSLKNELTALDISWKRNFGSIPTQHNAYAREKQQLIEQLGHDNLFPEAEYQGNYGIHFGCHQYLEQEDLDYIVSSLKQFLVDRL